MIVNNISPDFKNNKSFKRIQAKNEITTSESHPIIPQGCFALRQPAAAVYEKPFVPLKKGKNEKLNAEDKKEVFRGYFQFSIYGERS